MDNPVVLFDGLCGLCDGFVAFAVRIDRGRNLRFAPLQGGTARALLGGEGSTSLDSIVLVDGGRIRRGSSAVLAILAHLGGPWRALALAAGLVPGPVLDALYRFVARHRYRWFGKRDACRVPTERERAAFLD